MKLNDLPPLTASPAALGKVVELAHLPEVGRHGDGPWSLVQDKAEQYAAEDFDRRSLCVRVWLARPKQDLDVLAYACATTDDEREHINDRLRAQYVYERSDDYVQDALDSMTDDEDGR